MWKSNFTREQESKARDSAQTQGFLAKYTHTHTQNGLKNKDKRKWK